MDPARVFEERKHGESDRRIGTRVRGAGMELTWRPSSGPHPGGQAFLPARVVDLSVTGVGLVAGSGVDVGSLMEIEHAGARGMVEVRWAGRHKDPSLARYGCAFVSLDDAFEHLVHELVLSARQNRSARSARRVIVAPKPRRCARCGTLLLRRSDRRYCSAACRHAAHRDRVASLPSARPAGIGDTR
jgi:hypothetical protein